MAAILQKIVKGYTWLNEDMADPRTKHLFLIDTLWRTPCLVFFYLYIIFVVGPKFMKNRQPYKIERIMQIYNILQIICNFYVFCLVLSIVLSGYNIRCEPVDYSFTPRGLLITKLCWYFYLLKIMDLFDTVFFVFRKKQNQVSFLHVYHHGGMVMAVWLAVKYYAGGQNIILGLLNTFVHSVMYTHYLLSSMKINTKSWKKYITQLQMIQFITLSWHYAQILWTDCGFPQWITLFMLPQNFFMFVLFGDFYYNSYIKSASTTASTKMETHGVAAQIVANGKLKEK